MRLTWSVHSKRSCFTNYSSYQRVVLITFLTEVHSVIAMFTKAFYVIWQGFFEISNLIKYAVNTKNNILHGFWQPFSTVIRINFIYKRNWMNHVTSSFYTDTEALPSSFLRITCFKRIDRIKKVVFWQCFDLLVNTVWKHVEGELGEKEKYGILPVMSILIVGDASCGIFSIRKYFITIVEWEVTTVSKDDVKRMADAIFG